MLGQRFELSDWDSTHNRSWTSLCLPDKKADIQNQAASFWIYGQLLRFPLQGTMHKAQGNRCRVQPSTII